jgi:hypothetical protein
LADHNTLQSLWIAVHGVGRLARRIIHTLDTNLITFSVYDLTAFSSDHPGGIDALESCAGIDGTEAYEYAGHSEENTIRLQQYRVGELIGTSGRAPPVSDNPVVSNTTHSAGSVVGLGQAILAPWAKLAVTLFTACGAVAFSYRQILAQFGTGQFPFTTIVGMKTGNGLLTGIAIASSVSLVGFGYLYRLFLSSLDYQNDVFSFPPAIPRKARR